MLNQHELLMLFVMQIGFVFLVQNIYPIFSTFGQQLDENNAYIKEAKNLQHSQNQSFYHFSNVNDFYSAHAQWLTDEKNVQNIMWLYSIPIQQTGVFIGSIFFGYLADHFGRRTICIYSFLLSSFVLAIEGFLTSPIIVTICRFLIGTQTGGMMIVSWSLATELISPKTRFLARAFANWPNGKVILCLICYLSRNWRISLHISALFSLFAALLYIFVVPESPTWLQLHGRREEAEAVCGRVFRRSGGKCIIALPTGFRTKTLTLAQIWRKEKYRRVIILFGAIWMMTNFTATMLDFSETVLFSDNLMASQMLLAGVPSIMKMLLGLVEIYLGIISRRNLHLFSLFISGSAMCASGLFVFFKIKESHPTLYVITYLTGYTSIEFVWDACYLCVVEQVPTEVRGTICGACSFLSRLVGILASKMTLVKSIWAPSPLFIAAIAAAIHFIIAYFFLDESKDANLGEVGFDLRKISMRVSRKIGAQFSRLTGRNRDKTATNHPVVVTVGE